MTEGMMGRGSDTRIYNPRSESSYMFRNNGEEDNYSPSDPRYADAEKEKKQKKKEAQEKKEKSRKHIKVKPKMLREFEDEEDEEENRDDSEKIDADREIHSQTGAAGNFGYLSSLAGGAKGPGAVRGEMVAMSEPMEHAWSELLKASKKEREKRMKQEARAKGKPSTGDFKKPKGGYSPKSATSRRAKALSRSLGGSKKTGLGRAHLAVEMSHRGIKTKQPMRLEDPRKYQKFQAQQASRAQQGQIRTQPITPQITQGYGYSTRGMPKPKLKPHRPPPIQPPTIAGAPHLAMSGASQVAMSFDDFKGSDIQKKYDWATVQELRHLLNRTKKLLREKEQKKKGYGTKDTGGGGSNLPKHPENGPKQTTRPEGATEDAKTDPRHFGLDSTGHDVGRGGRTA